MARLTASTASLLADHALADLGFHGEQFGALALQHPFHRDAGPARDHGGDVLARDLLAQHRAAADRGGLLELLLERGDAAILQLARLGEVARALRLLKLQPGGVELLLDLRLAGDLVLLGLPALW